MRTRATLICLLLAGCGGGGGEETAVSASPQPAATSPTPAPAPSAAAPTPATPAPVALPPASPPPAPPAMTPPSAPAAPPPAEAPTVKGIVLATALSSDTVYRGGPLGGAWINPVGHDAPGLYLFQFAGYSITSVKRDLDDPRPFPTLQIRAPMATGFGVSFGTAITAGDPDGQMTQMTGNPTAYPPDADVPIVGELVRWSAGSEYVRLLISDSGADGFNLCMHVEMAQYKRLMCNVFARSDGAWRGAYLHDDAGSGAREWR